jgi:hypothetical protein
MTMARLGHPAGMLRRKSGWSAAALSLSLISACHQTNAQAGAATCAPPPPWLAPGAKPGQPEAEFAACLKDQAYETRTLAIPLDANAYGIIAQCHVRVDRFEGLTIAASENGSEEARQAADAKAVRQAKADITDYRQCAGS